MRKLIVIAVLGLCVYSCNTEKNTEEISSSDQELVTAKKEAVKPSEGQKLMEQKCFICHFKTPDPSRRDQMIAPPMMRVQEHYKPVYPERSEFVSAVMNIVNNPSEENTLMPGAIRKFNVMPKVEYNQQELKLIAETLFEMEFGGAEKTNGRGMQHSKIVLDNGEKWIVKKSTMNKIEGIVSELNGFKSDKVSDYNRLGKEVFDQTKSIMTDKAYNGEVFDQIHNFFGGVETNMHKLMAVKTVEEGEHELSTLKVKFKQFTTYFRSKD